MGTPMPAKKRILHQLLLLDVFLETLGVTELNLGLVSQHLLKSKMYRGDNP